MHIQLADFSRQDLQSLLRDYLAFAKQDACSHALDLNGLQATDMHMFTARDVDGALMGCAALKTLNSEDGEIKSVRTHDDHLRKGVSRRLMTHIELTAKRQGLTTLYLETHNTAPYAPACQLYESLGYVYCPPFGSYTQNPRNIFMKKSLS